MRETVKDNSERDRECGSDRDCARDRKRQRGREAGIKRMRKKKKLRNGEKWGKKKEICLMEVMKKED